MPTKINSISNTHTYKANFFVFILFPIFLATYCGQQPDNVKQLQQQQQKIEGKKYI